MTITAKFASGCAACDAPIRKGDSIEWIRGSKRTYHSTCARALDRGVDPAASRYSSAAMAEDERQFEYMAGESFVAGLR
jgi:hypothetical protein